MAKEKKYFMADTDEEVLLGDVISSTLVKDFGEGRKIEREIEFKLTEETLPIALNMGIIEEEESKEDDNEKDDNLIDFDEENCPFKDLIDRIIFDQEEQEKRVDALEEEIKTQNEMLNTMMNDLKDCIADISTIIKANKKPISSKKK